MAKQQEGNDNKATRCGIGNYRPDWLQVLNNPFVLCALLGIYILNHGTLIVVKFYPNDHLENMSMRRISP